MQNDGLINSYRLKTNYGPAVLLVPLDFIFRTVEAKRGIELLAAALETVRPFGHMPTQIPTTCFLGAGYWLAGEEDKARQTLEALLKIAGPCGARYYIGWAQRVLGEIALKANTAQALEHFEKSIAVLQEIKAENELALAYAGYGRLQKQQGQFAQARDLLRRALEIFERLGTLIEPGKIRKELAELPEEVNDSRGDMSTPGSS